MSSDSDSDSDDDIIFDSTIISLNNKNLSNQNTIYNNKNEKKIRFNEQPTIHKMIVWSFAYRAARKSVWEIAARDRVRFRNRISNMEIILKPILNAEHRLKIWLQRFC